MVTPKNKLLTAGDLLRLSSKGFRGELIDGVLHETVPAGKRHARIAGRLITSFNNFVIPRRSGQVGGTDGGVLLQRNPDMVREPDVYFVSTEKLSLDDDSDGYLEVVPELVVEIVSPSDSDTDVAEKIKMWLDHGVSMALEVRPAQRAVRLHRRGVAPVTLTGDDVLDGGDVLPGFTLPLSEIFDL